MADDGKLNVLGICGSLRRASYNGGLLRAAKALAPAGMSIAIGDISAIPLYNGDVEREGFPKSVHDFRERIRAADALLIATPEYNYSVPGVLKNAIDWASRSPDQPLAGKPVAIMGATPGGFGTTRSQHHLRQVFIGVGSSVLAAARSHGARSRRASSTTRAISRTKRRRSSSPISWWRSRRGRGA